MGKGPKPLKELNLTSRFLFDEVMEDTETLRDALCIILEREIPLLPYSETEKELRVSPLLRSIRLDVITMDEESVVYSTEMQSEKKSDLKKRSRYYQALVDINLLEPGIPNYNLLNETYIIIITTSDIFGYGKYRYTFRAVCEEVPECALEDKAVRIFLNTKGTNEGEVSEELVEFLHYVEETTDGVAEEVESTRIKRIHERVCKVKTSEKVGVKYMQAWEEKYYEREEGRKEGIEEGVALAKKVLKMDAEKIPVETIAKECNVSVEQIKEILK